MKANLADVLTFLVLANLPHCVQEPWSASLGTLETCLICHTGPIVFVQHVYTEDESSWSTLSDVKGSH